jgi:uncharacterized protein (TIGR00725 family)
MFGIMEESAKGAQEAGGQTIGIVPSISKEGINDYIDIPIVTSMHAGRNYMNILSSDILIFVSVNSPGTLSELAHAIQMKKPIYILNFSKNLKEYITELSDKINFVDSVDDLSRLLK